jgi:hypothetical protein
MIPFSILTIEKGAAHFRAALGQVVLKSQIMGTKGGLDGWLAMCLDTQNRCVKKSAPGSPCT